MNKLAYYTGYTEKRLVGLGFGHMTGSALDHAIDPRKQKVAMLKEASSALLNKHPLTLDSNQARNRNILKFQNLRNKGLFRGGLSNTQADKKAFYGLLMRATGQKSYMPEGGVTRLGAAGRKDSPHNIKYRQQQLMELKRKIAGTQQEAPIGRPVRNATGPHGIGMGPGGGRADGSGLL